MQNAKFVQDLRIALGEEVEEFGMRFARSGRTVEDWEQGRYDPPRRVLELMHQIKQDLEREMGG